MNPTTSAVETQSSSTPLAETQAQKKRYALVGLGARARMFTSAIAGDFRDKAELVGLCDISPTRIEWHNNKLREDHDYPPVRGYSADEFETMLAEQSVDIAII